MKVKVTKETVIITELNTINAGETGVNTCEFQLPEEFSSLTVTAAFNNIPVAVSDNKCIIPTLKKGTVVLGVYAYKESDSGVELMYSPKPTAFYVNEGSYSEEIGSEEIPTISEYEKYCRMFTEALLEKTKDNEKTANKTREINESSTHEQYPTAKAVYDALSDIDVSGLVQNVDLDGCLAISPKHKPFTKIINDCQTLADWNTNSASNCEADTENYILGNQSIHSANGGMVCVKNTMDMLNNNLVLQLRINSIANASNLYMQILNVSNPSKSVVYSLLRGTDMIPTGEWVEITVPYAAYSYGAFDDVDFTKIDYIRIYASGEVDWNLQSVGTRPVVLDKGIVTFTFDDGYASQGKGIKLLAEKGITGTLFYIPEADTNGSSDYLKIPDLQKFVNYYGTDIQVHGAEDYNTKTDEELIAHWENTQKLFKENGLGDGKYMSYPNNGHENRVVQLAKRFFDGCRTINYDVPLEGYPLADRYRVRSVSSINRTAYNDIEKVKSLIDRAMLSKSWLVLTFHRIEDGDTSMYCSEADFKEIRDYAISSGAYIMNYAQVMESTVVNTNLGNVSKALDNIIDIQNNLIGGTEE